MKQVAFNPLDYGFEWTETWYRWDPEKGHAAALAERNKAARVAKDEGHQVRKYTSRGQLITRGGVGTGRPEIKKIVNVYMLEIE